MRRSGGREGLGIRGGEAEVRSQRSECGEGVRRILQWWAVFTGIVEQSVPIENIADAPRLPRVVIRNSGGGVGGGESISLNGCCLTVAEMMEGKIGFDVVIETLSKTNLGLLKIGDRVHLERSLRVGDRID